MRLVHLLWAWCGGCALYIAWMAGVVHGHHEATVLCLEVVQTIKAVTP